MRARLRNASPFGNSVPWWLALPLGLVWGVLAIFFFICLGVWIVARFMTQQAQRGWRALARR